MKAPLKQTLFSVFSLAVFLLTGTIYGNSREKHQNSNLPYQPAVYSQNSAMDNFVFVSEKKGSKEMSDKNRMWVGFAFNTVLGFGIGSFIQKDIKAGTTFFLIDSIAFSLFLTSFSTAGDSPIAGAFLVPAAVILLTTRVIQIIRPFWFYEISTLLDPEKKVSLFITPKVDKNESTKKTSIDGVRAGIAFKF